jgi:XRE family transcriptional regulator, regulator of sulfur utilization
MPVGANQLATQEEPLQPSRPSKRDVIVCVHCSLSQFRTASPFCRRCLRALYYSGTIRRATDHSEEQAWGQALDISSLGATIRELRRSKGWSQAKLAEQMRTGRSHVSRIECERIMPSLRNLERIARALDVDMFALLLRVHARGVQTHG